MAQATAIPVYGQHVSSEANQRSLAAAVFSTALEDLRGHHQRQRRDALYFLLRDESDFVFWCQLLKVDPQAFRKRLAGHILGPLEGVSGLIEALVPHG